MSCHVCPPSIDLKTILACAGLFLSTVATRTESIDGLSQRNIRRMAGTNTNNLFIFLNLIEQSVTKLILLSFISVIFGFGLDIIFRYVCLVLSTGGVKKGH